MDAIKKAIPAGRLASRCELVLVKASIRKIRPAIRNVKPEMRCALGALLEEFMMRPNETS